MKWLGNMTTKELCDAREKVDRMESNDFGKAKADAVNRITREVREALPHWEHDDPDNIESITHLLLNYDLEVMGEIENLIRLIIEEVKDEPTK